jgi:hypothetical protein
MEEKVERRLRRTSISMGESDVDRPVNQDPNDRQIDIGAKVPQLATAEERTATISSAASTGSLTNDNYTVYVNIQQPPGTVVLDMPKTGNQVPNITIINRGLTLQCSDEMMKEIMKTPNDQETLMKLVYGFKLLMEGKIENEVLEPEDLSRGKIQIATNKDSANGDIPFFSISFDNQAKSYSLKGHNKANTMLDKFFPQEYMSLFRGIVSVLCISMTIVIIYLCVGLIGSSG